MSMEQAITDFPKQFKFEPEIINPEKLKDKYDYFVVGGMGGSNLSSGIMKLYQPGIDLYTYRDYGLPPYDDEFFKKSLLVANSYSGNTEETFDFLQEGYSKGYDCAVISTGGKMIDFAEENKLPHIQIPNTGIQPRSALGYQLIALAKMIQHDDCCGSLPDLADTLKPEDLEEKGQELAESLKGKVPIIYSSVKNLSIAYNWKIKFNETGKVPAFYNLFPELNHNEMNGFDVVDSTRELSDKLHFIFIHDAEDSSKIQKRMEIVEKLYEERGLSVTSIYLEGQSVLEKTYNSLLLADWTALYLARSNGSEPEKVPMIEDFKKRLSH